MKLRKDPEKFLTVRTAYIWSALVGVIGVVLIIVFDGGVGPVPRALSLLGQALFSAGVVAITFGWISSEENEVRINRIIKLNIKETLRPVISRFHENAQADRSWKCHLEAPKGGDSLPDYLYQVLTVSYSILDCPTELRFVGIAGASPDWSPYMDYSYQFRWEFDEGLDPNKNNVFRVENVRLDGQVLDQPQEIQSDDGICERVYKVPRGNCGQEVRISFVVLVRKFLGNESRISITTKIFHDVDRAEFMLSVGSSVRAKNIQYSCDGVTTWTGGLVDHESEMITDPSGGPVSRSVRLLEPIQRDSQVSFEIARYKE